MHDNWSDNEMVVCPGMDVSYDRWRVLGCSLW